MTLHELAAKPESYRYMTIMEIARAILKDTDYKFEIESEKGGWMVAAYAAEESSIFSQLSALAHSIDCAAITYPYDRRVVFVEQIEGSR